MRLFSAATLAQQAVLLRPYYDSAHAAVLMSHTGVKQAAGNDLSYGLAGRLYLSKSGWLLLSVPNALGRGAFDALYEQGVELPTRDTNDPNEVFNAHISVMSKKEVDQIGADNISERGHFFRYTLGPVKEITPTTWDGVSRVWAIEVYSPELKNLRKSYDLSPLPGPNGDYQFHITFAIRRTNALRQAKAASGIDPSFSAEHAEECCPKCGARLEQNTYDEKCNRCGEKWLKGESAATSGLSEKHAGFSDKLKALRKRRGECVDCGTVLDVNRVAETCPDCMQKQANGDELAFKAWKALGYSNEEADRRAGDGTPFPADKKVTPVKTQKRVREDEIEICPHCDEEIREKSVYMDPENYLYHRPCMDKGPIKHITPLSKDELYERLGWTKDAGINEDIDAAAAECEEPKSKEQAEAGNYRHGHCRLHGMGITIETGRGMTRKGTSKSGKPWSIVMAHHYGYIKRTLSEADEDHVDVFIGPDAESEIVFVVDQYIDDSFDESKCMLGFKSKDAAKEGYLACYDKGWKGLGTITAATISQFKDWVFNGDTGKPFSTHARKTWQEKTADVRMVNRTGPDNPDRGKISTENVKVAAVPSLSSLRPDGVPEGARDGVERQTPSAGQRPGTAAMSNTGGVTAPLTKTSTGTKTGSGNCKNFPLLGNRLPAVDCAPDFQKILSPVSSTIKTAQIRQVLLGAKP